MNFAKFLRAPFLTEHVWATGSGFRPSDSCVNQQLAITHEILEAFDCNPPLEVRSVFLDMSKAFDKA